VSQYWPAGINLPKANVAVCAASSVVIFGLSTMALPPLLPVKRTVANFRSTALSVMRSTGASTSIEIATVPRNVSAAAFGSIVMS
jgi:hypothetical protein